VQPVGPESSFELDLSAEEDRLTEERFLSEERRLSEDHITVLGHDAALGPIFCQAPFDCIGGTIANSQAGTVIDFLIDIFFMLYMFKGLGEICDSYFMDSLEEISEALQLSPDVAGATFMAAGSSAPELFTSISTTFFIVSDGGVGTIIGSAIFNIFFIVGATGFFACKNGVVLDIWWYPLTRDTIFYLISIGLLMWVLMDEEVEVYESAIMWFTYLVYIGYMLINPKVVDMLGGEPGKAEAVEAYAVSDLEKGEDKKVETNGAAKEEKENGAAPPVIVKTEEAKPEEDSAEKDNTEKDNTEKEPAEDTGKGSLEVPGATGENPGGLSPSASPRGSKVHFSLHGLEQEEVAEERRKSKEVAEAQADTETPEGGGEKAEEKAEEEEDEPKSCIDRFDPISRLWAVTMPSKEHYWMLFFMSVFWIMILSYIMVDACARMGYILNVPTFFMGLIFLAAGTSIPDALASIAVAKQGEGNMAISNALGSNVFDILLGLGVPWTLGILTKGRNIIFFGASDYLVEWIIILTLVVVVFFLVLILNKWKLTQKLGGVFFGCYFVYVAYAVIRQYA
jgi:K+-dependent Na+/Ca+ exchanger-like protein